MIVAGVGFRKNASGKEIVAAVDAALARHAFERNRLTRLATSLEKSAEAGMTEAGRLLELDITGVEATRLAAMADGTITHSEKSSAATGVPSLSEAAALAAAGEGARLLGPRIAVGPVTCALAEQAR